MRVLVCTDPGTVHSQRFVDGLRAKAETAIFWFGDRRDYSEYKVPHYPVGISRPVNVWGGRTIVRDYVFLSTVLFFKPTLIHIHREPRWCRYFRRWAPQIPIVFTAWGYFEKSSLKGSWARQVSYADGLTGDSRALVEQLQVIPGCDNKLTHVFRFGISEESFRPAPPSMALKEKLGIPPDCKLVYSPRSLRAIYNHETLVSAIPLVLQQIPNAYFLFVDNHGHRYPDAAAYRQKLQAQIDYLGVSSRVRFLEHIQDHSHVSELYQTADAAVCIPLEDAFAVTILEAMACGTPLIVSDLRDYDEIVDSSNGIRIPPGNVDALAHALQTVLAIDKEQSPFRSAGLATVAAKGMLDSELDRLIDFYGLLLKNKNTRI